VAGGDLKKPRDPFQILGCVHAEGLVVRFGDPDLAAVLDCPQLLQPFGLFERTDRQLRVREQKLTPVHVEAGVLVVHGIPAIAELSESQREAFMRAEHDRWLRESLLQAAASESRPGAIALHGSILFAEDGLDNQRLISAHLRKAGANVTIAPNGKVAVDLMGKAHFDLVLMDMQMPVMDGLDATRAIRLKPQFQSLPIIAMTANVMESDRERCTEAGMNDHLAKPIDPEALSAALLRWIKPRGDAAKTAVPKAVVAEAAAATVIASSPQSPQAPQASGSAATTPFAIAGVDTQTALRRTGGNPKRYEMLLRKFAETSAMQEIRNALAAGDAETAAREAHSLKGSAANLGATAVANAAAELETAIKSGGNVPPLLEATGASLTTVVQAIRAALPQEQVVESVDSAAADPASVLAPLRRLKTLLANDDGDAADFIVDAQPDLAKVLTGPEITALRDFVGNYDFIGALKCVTEIAGRLGLRLE